MTNMAEELLNIATVADYGEMLGLAAQHASAGVFDLSAARPMRHLRHTFSFYVVYLKDEVNCEILYGRQRYDYAEGSVVALAPGQVIGTADTGEDFQPRGWALCFDAELIRGTWLGRRIREYTFFAYRVNEALHLARSEREVFVGCLRRIASELEGPADALSRRLVVANIGLLLDYCLRFYERQFATRRLAGSDLLSRFERLVDERLGSRSARAEGLPTVKWCAAQLCLSPNYFGDLIRKETGRPAKVHIQEKIVELAKEKLFSQRESISQIADELGFRYPQHFTRLFKSVAGCTPEEYRRANLR